jgi:type IV pilus assembly protein PilE
MRRATGFTLIEVLIVVAIVGFLAAIAFPAYTSYIQRSKIAEAVANLSDMRVKLEQHFLDNRTYKGACAAGSVAPKPAGDNAKYFDYECALDDTTYVISAKGKAAHALTGLEYTINERNERKTISVPTGWTAPASSCWALKKDGSC